MSCLLPDLDVITMLPASLWKALRERFHAAGFRHSYPADLMQPGIGLHAECLQRPVALWHLRQRRDSAALLFLMFVLGDPIGRTEAADVLGREVVDALTDAGMMTLTQDNGIVSAFVLRVFRGFLVLCDDLSHHGDAVYGVGYGTQAFCDHTPGSRIARALDLACGAGAISLWLSTWCDKVVATDINPRALAFVRINMLLNGVSNIDLRLGSLFEPVAGESFDFIASQPPYVPMPSAVTPAAYLYGGPRGNELVGTILASVPRHLNPGGRAMIVFEHPVLENGEDALLSPSVAGVNTLFILGTEVRADSYAMRLGAPALRTGIDAYDRAVTAMRSHLHDMGIRGLCSAICVVEKGAAIGWTAAVQGGDAIWAEMSGQMIARLMAAQTACHQAPRETVRDRVCLPAECLLIRPAADNACADVHLGLPAGYPLPSLRLSADEWQTLQAHDGQQPLAADFRLRLARAGLLAGDSCPTH